MAYLISIICVGKRKFSKTVICLYGKTVIIRHSIVQQTEALIASMHHCFRDSALLNSNMLGKCVFKRCQNYWVLRMTQEYFINHCEAVTIFILSSSTDCANVFMLAQIELNKCLFATLTVNIKVCSIFCS